MFPSATQACRPLNICALHGIPLSVIRARMPLNICAPYSIPSLSYRQSGPSLLLLTVSLNSPGIARLGRRSGDARVGRRTGISSGDTEDSESETYLREEVYFVSSRSGRLLDDLITVSSS